MDGELGRRQREDEPAPAGVCRRHAQYVCEERPDLRGFRGEHDGVYSGDHPAILVVGYPVIGAMLKACRA
jgi:hypothetical protein